MQEGVALIWEQEEAMGISGLLNVFKGISKIPMILIVGDLRKYAWNMGAVCSLGL